MLQTNVIENFWRHVDKKSEDECWLWLASKSWKGYGFANINRVSIGAHRLSYMINVGNIPRGMHILHTCDVPACVNPLHLKLGTNVTNVNDKIAKDRQYRPTGELNTFSKLSTNEVIEIRQRLRTEEKVSSIAKAFSISARQIRNIRDRISWSHIV